VAEVRRFFDPSQPQTLQGAVMLCYLNAALGLLALVFGGALLVVALALGVAGYGVANERRWGYWLGIVVAGLIVFLDLYELASGVYPVVINMLFTIVLLALFLHPQSREYQRIWFH
jgi:uncharacterized membrane protein (DUF2068 family)